MKSSQDLRKEDKRKSSRQGAMRQCENCDSIFIDDYVGKKEFCSDKCKKQFNSSVNGEIKEALSDETVEALQRMGENAKKIILGGN